MEVDEIKKLAGELLKKECYQCGYLFKGYGKYKCYTSKCPAKKINDMNVEDMKV